jgi:hypothetical protein
MDAIDWTSGQTIRASLRKVRKALIPDHGIVFLRLGRLHGHALEMLVEIWDELGAQGAER